MSPPGSLNSSPRSKDDFLKGHQACLEEFASQKTQSSNTVKSKEAEYLRKLRQSAYQETDFPTNEATEFKVAKTRHLGVSLAEEAYQAIATQVMSPTSRPFI